MSTDPTDIFRIYVMSVCRLTCIKYLQLLLTIYPTEAVRKVPYESDLDGVEATVAREVAWLKRQRGEDPEEEKTWRPKKLHRVASQSSFLRWDCSLRAMGLDLKRFKMPPLDKDRPNPLLWPWMNICLDGASPNTCATSFMCRVLCLIITAIWDIDHSSWNSEQQTIKDCGLYKWMLLMLVAFNVMQGPWNSSERFRESRDRLEMLAKQVDPRRLPAFMAALPDMVAELGLDASDPDIAQKVFDHCMHDGPVKSRGFKGNLNRFYGFVAEGEKALPQYSQRGYCTLHVSLESDYLAGVEKLKFRPASSDGVGPTSVPGPDERAVRDAAGNCFSIATMMYQDETSRMKLAIVVVTGRFNRLWQGTSNIALRGVNTVGKWLRDQMGGKFMHTMYLVMGVLSSAVAVAEVGFVLPPPHAAVGSWEAGEVEMQDCFALLFYKYRTSLVGNRLLSEMWWLNGWPLQFVLFTSDSHEARAAVQFLRIAFDAFKSFEEFATRHAGLTRIAKRSVFHNPDVQQLIAILKDSDWKITPDIEEWADHRWKGAFQTQSCEDGFNREKRDAVKHQNNRVGRELLAYGTLVESDVVKLPKYTEVE